MPKFMAKDEVKDADKNLLGFGAIEVSLFNKALVSSQHLIS